MLFRVQITAPAIGLPIFKWSPLIVLQSAQPQYLRPHHRAPNAPGHKFNLGLLKQQQMFSV